MYGLKGYGEGLVLVVLVVMSIKLLDSETFSFSKVSFEGFLRIVGVDR
jgi:hypothetical protein